MYQPVGGLSERYKEAQRCLEILCRYLNSRIVHQSTSVTFDFIAYAPAEVSSLFDCLEYLSPTKQV
jgi:hypothetical protein